MLERISPKKVLAIATVASLFSLSSLCLPESVWAEQTPKNPNQGLPTRRIGGGTRGGSPNNDEQARQCSSLVALSPNYLVTTVEASPKLFFCIPSIEQSQATKIEFTLKDRSDRPIYQTNITPVASSGIASLQFPLSSTLKELEINQNYRWNLTIVNEGGDRHEALEGWIRRIEMKPTLAEKLAQASPLERVQLYQEARLWYEAIEELAQLKRDRPDDREVSEQWTQLLASMNLDAIAQVPLLDKNLAPATVQSQSRLNSAIE
jgi:hypothetical protein